MSKSKNEQKVRMWIEYDITYELFCDLLNHERQLFDIGIMLNYDPKRKRYVMWILKEEC